MSRNQNDTKSLFVSLPGVLGLLVLTVTTAYVHLGVLPYILFVSFLVSFVSYLWSQFSLRKLSLSTKGSSSRVFPGEDISFSVEVSNDKFLPLLWLEADYFDEAPGFLSSEENFRRKFTWIGPMQSLEWDVSFHAERRGVVFLDSLAFLSGDGFGLSVERKKMELEEKYLLVVYPKVFRIDAEDLVRDTLEMNPGKKGYVEDYSLFRGNRDYLPGDSSRFINWRVLAKGGAMTVNQFEPVVPECVTFLLDLKSFSRWEETTTTGGTIMTMVEFYEAALEEMISLTASCILALIERRVKCSLMLPDVTYIDDTTGERKRVPEKVVRPEDLEAQIPDLLTELAGINYHGEESFFSKSEMAQQMHGIGQVYLVVKSPEETKMKNLLGVLEEVDLTFLSYDDEKMQGYKTKTLGELRKKNE
ncbi:MAG: DUF58 domain-containing protein [Spirochaetales bacterium]|nr:DUF58 domain-containing protein [Candidatus Physcosoma equi]